VKIVDKKTKAFLKEKFPKISSDELFPEEDEWFHPFYSLFFLSVFDHWLTVEEAESEVFHYGQIEKQLSQKDNQAAQIYFEREKRLLTFYQNLYGLYSLYEHRGSEPNKDKFYTFETTEEYAERCLKSIREKDFIRLCVPELEVVLNGGFDLTHKIFLDKSCSIGKIKELATSCGLFIL